VLKRIILAVKRVVVGWFHVIILNFHAPTENKFDDMKDSSTRNLIVFHKFSKYQVTTLLGDTNAKVGKEKIFKQLEIKTYTKLVMIMELE
jgi:hypothetical protein